MHRILNIDINLNIGSFTGFFYYLKLLEAGWEIIVLMTKIV